MKFHLFQALFKKTLLHFSCEKCSNHEVNDADISILEISPKHFTIAITCSHCGHTTYISSWIGIQNIPHESPNSILDWVTNESPLLQKNKSPIAEKEILSIHKKIKDKDISVDAFLENL